jgi:hypothetical protein
MEVFRECWRPMPERKKYWLLPIVTILGIFSLLFYYTQGSAIAPFIW